MMHRTIAAILALTPVLLHAQANSPAQHVSADRPAVLRSSIAEPKAPGVGDIPSATPSAHRISTGVIAPKLIHSIAIDSDNSPIESAGVSRTTVVKMIVEKDGTPTDLAIAQSLGPIMDHNILQAVSQYRFIPATVSNVPTAAPVNLEIVIQGSRR